LSSLKKITKARLLQLIDELEKYPHDKVRILGQVGIVSMAVAVGTPVAATAVISGVTYLFGWPTAVKLFGWAAIGIGSGPAALIFGAAAALGYIAYAMTRLVHGGGLAEGRKAELLEKYREDVICMKAKENRRLVTGMDRTQFILSLRDLIDHDAIPVSNAFKMIELVEQGRISLSHASSLLQNLLSDKALGSIERLAKRIH
jgi:hypothetical protein